MKQTIGDSQTSNTTDTALLIARIGIAALMLTHGVPKLMMLLSGAPVQFPPVLGMSAQLSLLLAVFAEVGCSVLILAGFLTRWAAIPLTITMLVAVFMFHAADPFSVKESALHYLLVYIVLLVAGSGKYSIDYLLQRKSTTTTFTNNKQVHDPTLAIYQ